MLLPLHISQISGRLKKLPGNSLDGVECTVHHSDSRGVAGVMSITIPLLSIKDLAVGPFHKNGAC